MSQRPINLSADLQQLKNEGYELQVRSGHLLVKSVPYVNSSRELKRGTLVMKLDLAGDVSITPQTHVAYFSGEHPCHADGRKIQQIEHGSGRNELANRVIVDHSFSARPLEGHYRDFHHKVSHYVETISRPAREIDRDVTAQTHAVVVPDESDESPFEYEDTASSRSEIGKINERLSGHRLAIVGLGGTGSYVADLVSKTYVREIHFFDGDYFNQHNAFRCPGAPSISELSARPKKASYFKKIYSNLHRNVEAHDYYVDESNVDQLRGFNFVFICVDRGSARRVIVDKLEEFRVSFIDVGMGVKALNEMVLSALRVSCSTEANRADARKRLSFSDEDADNDYSRDIQIADLNCLNATLAVLRWKRLFGIYHDLEKELFSVYVSDGNHIFNEAT